MKIEDGRVGQRVVCIDSADTFLKNGIEYVIREVDRPYFRLTTTNGGFYPVRFEPAADIQLHGDAYDED